VRVRAREKERARGGLLAHRQLLGCEALRREEEEEFFNHTQRRDAGSVELS